MEKSDSESMDTTQPPKLIPITTPQHDVRYLPGPSHEVEAIEIKLQEFWINDPVTWFTVTEIQFDLQRASDKTKYLSTLRALPPSACKKIDDFLQDPPSENLYNSIKSALLDRLAPSDERKLEQLLSGQDLGDGRPSEVLRSIRALAGSNFSDHIIRSLWVRRLPPIIKTAIVGQPTSTPLEELKKQADRIFEYLTPEQQISEFSRSRPRNRTPQMAGNNSTRTRPIESNSLSMSQRMSRIETIIDKYFSGRNYNMRQRSSSNKRTRSATPKGFTQGRRSHYDGICFYHHFFSHKAHRCVKPCKYERGPSQDSVDGHMKKN